MAKQFQKIVEDFVCEVCGAEIEGNGYTNHCPRCLVSKHVDVSPGDRASECGGLMHPVAIELKNGEQKLVHECETCGYRKTNVVQEEDSRDALYALAKKLADKESGRS